MVQMTPTEAAYLAGILDGEGTISVATAKGKRYRTLNAVLCVANTNLAMLAWIRDRVGGNLRATKFRPGKNWKRVFRWDMTGYKNVRPVLDAVYPFLVIKRRQAEEVMAIGSLLVPQDRIKQKFDQVLSDERDAAVGRIRLLNRRGLAEAL